MESTSLSCVSRSISCASVLPLLSMVSVDSTQLTGSSSSLLASWIDRKGRRVRRSAVTAAPPLFIPTLVSGLCETGPPFAPRPMREIP